MKERIFASFLVASVAGIALYIYAGGHLVVFLYGLLVLVVVGALLFVLITLGGGTH